MKETICNSYDIDGVIFMGKDRLGVKPHKGDIIITGRSYEEYSYTEKMMADLDITNPVYYNPISFQEKSRETSGRHKANTINALKNQGIIVQIHYEDDPIQAKIIEDNTDAIVVLLVHDLVEKENIWHGK